MRSDSDSNTTYAFSTPSTLCSESERKNETSEKIRNEELGIRNFLATPNPVFLISNSGRKSK